MKKALLVIFLDTHLTELHCVAHCLQNPGRYVPEFFFARAYPTQPWDMAACMNRVFPSYDLDGGPYVVRPQQNEPDEVLEEALTLPCRIWRWLYPWLSNNLLWAWREYLQLQTKVSRFLKEQNIDVLIVTEENVGFATQIWTQTAHAANVPAVVVTYTVADASERFQ